MDACNKFQNQDPEIFEKKKKTKRRLKTGNPVAIAR